MIFGTTDLHSNATLFCKEHVHKYFNIIEPEPEPEPDPNNVCTISLEDL